MLFQFKEFDWKLNLNFIKKLKIRGKIQKSTNFFVKAWAHNIQKNHEILSFFSIQEPLVIYFLGLQVFILICLTDLCLFCK